MLSQQRVFVYLGVTKPEPTAAVTASGCTPKPNFRSRCLSTLSLGSIILGRVVRVRRACAYRLLLSVNSAICLSWCHPLHMSFCMEIAGA